MGNKAIKPAEKDIVYTSGEWFTPVPGARYTYDYQTLITNIKAKAASFKKRRDQLAYEREAYQFLCIDDLYFLTYFGMGRKDMNDSIGAPFFAERARDVQYDRNNTLDLWARDHRKSTYITYAATIQDILADPNSATGIFSHNRPIAKAFLDSIRTYLESPRLISWFPHILYDNPRTKAPAWGLDSGIKVKRTTARQEATVEAWGLVDSMPTSKHFDHLDYDDVVDQDTVGTKEQMDKVMERFQLSHNLGTRDATRRIAGTRYHYGDPYGTMIESKMWNLRLHTIYGGERKEGDGVYFTHDQIMAKLKLLGPYIFSCQLLLEPVPEGEQKFRIEWIQRNEHTPPGLNCYIICDPANEKKKSRNHDPDFTVVWVVGVGPRGYRYLLDGARGRLNLEERWVALRDLVKKWHPLNVGYEKYGKDSDIQHFEHRMVDENVQFNIVPLGGNLGKRDRIQRLVPIFYNKKFFIPKAGIPYTDKEENKIVDLAKVLINEEMSKWPHSQHDDMLDCLNRIEDRLDLGIIEPYENESMNKMQDEMTYAAFNEINEEVLY